MVDQPSPRESDYLYTLANRGEYSEIIRHIQHHDDQEVRYGAAGVLAESVHSFEDKMTPEARKALITAVLEEPSDAVRANVLKVLIHVDESIIDNIIARLEMEPRSTPTGTPYPLILTKWHAKRWPELRYLAVAGFGSVASQSTIQKLRTTLNREENLRVLRRAIEESGNVGDERFVTPIQEHLRVDEEQYQQSANESALREVKEAAVEALVKIGTNAAYEALVTASRGTDEDLKEHVISEIGKFGAQTTVDLIVDELHNEENDELREEAAEGIITSFTQTDFEEGHSVREEALDLIGEDVSTSVSNEFADIVRESPRKSEQRNAAWLLGQLDTTDQETLECLLASLEDDDAYLRKVATASLTNLDPIKVEDKMETYLEQVEEGTEAHKLATFIKENIKDEAEEAKKELVNYSYVGSPSDYTAQQ
ncbi:MAG: HEAT repeat protein [Halonotius sp. J07HN6]|nr:MAG: HEAT repeat protein [Halonotius sp. J07HN6]